jgi:ribonuclease HI
MYAIFSDGGSRGNPGRGACAFVIYEPSEPFIIKNSKILNPEIPTEILASGRLDMGICTNNQAEWQGVILGMENLIKINTTEKVQLLLDSELVVKQLLGIYKVKNEGLKPYYLKAKKLLGLFKEVQISHIFREYNKEADRLYNQF